MDIEELTKSQTVLLTLLVSFMTSMATGIVTVALMSQTPPAIAERVDRVIQQTIKEVTAPSQPASASTAAVVKTVVVNQSDVIASAIARASPSVVHLYTDEASGGTFLGLGTVITTTGMVVTDTAALADMPGAIIKISGDISIPMVVTTRDALNGLVYLRPATSTATTTPPWVPITLARAIPSLGETVVSFAGRAVQRVSSGIVTSWIPETTNVPALAETNISGDNVMYGSPFIDTNGALVGISTTVSRNESGGAFIPARDILLSTIQK